MRAIRVFRAVVLLPCTGGSQGTAAVLDASVIACHPLPGSALYHDTARALASPESFATAGACRVGHPAFTPQCPQPNTVPIYSVGGSSGERCVALPPTASAALDENSTTAAAEFTLRTARVQYGAERYPHARVRVKASGSPEVRRVVEHRPPTSATGARIDMPREASHRPPPRAPIAPATTSAAAASHGLLRLSLFAGPPRSSRSTPA